MEQWKSIDELLDFAIANEERAVIFYRELAKDCTNEDTAAIFENYAVEEKEHKAKLENIKAGGSLKPAAEEILNLKIADYLIDEKAENATTYQDALILAMQREKAAFKLYSNMAGKTSDPEIRNLLLALAQEEAKHKLRFELEYDDHILTDN